MGEHADDAMNGAFCNHCGRYLGLPECGYPRHCWDCRDEIPTDLSVIKNGKEQDHG